MMLKALFILPVTCFAIYAFATPESKVVEKLKTKVAAVEQSFQEIAAPTEEQTAPAVEEQIAESAVPVAELAEEPAVAEKTIAEVPVAVDPEASSKKEDLPEIVLTSLAKTSAEAPKDSVYNTPEKMAEFEGGFEAMYAWIGQNLKYPQEAEKNGIQGRVTIQFVIEKDGTISEVKALRNPNKLLAEEAERIVRLTAGKWTPAKEKGEIVRSHFRLPINFRLNTPPVNNK